MESERFLFSGPAGDLEGEWHPAASECRGAAVVLHPHPLYGGTMDNTVVLVVAEALAHRGLDTLRFNFRGVGRSEGEHERGAGEVSDLAAAIDLCAHSQNDLQTRGAIWLAGYSFGAAVLLSALGAKQPKSESSRGALLLAPPVQHYDFSAVRDTTVPLALICGTEDDLTPKTAIDACVGDWLSPTRLEWIEGVGHDLGSFGSAERLREAIDACLDSLGLSGS